MTQSDQIPHTQLADGHRMPILGFGTWQLTGSDAYDSIRYALEVGYRHLDTATMYHNESEVGRALAASGLTRDDVFVTTKLPPNRVGHERETLSDSLRALGVDYVDLWLVHWPPDGKAAPGTWERFVAARDAGLVRSIGVSNYSTAQIDELTAATGVTPAVNQIKWSPAIYDAQRAAELAERRVVLEGYSPFRAGDLTDPELVRIAREHGVTPAQVILRWHVEHGFVAIPKSSNRDRIAANFDVFGFELSDDDVAQLDGTS